ncbi:hypothetical protein DL96DRAFT_1592456 [Flagelloscypha sp. PMI_526]|nr:hypothetical protein DL96DRAFT_1592456 [Flagelloscypha sp. PMI_526]
MSSQPEPLVQPIFDQLDIDLVLKVLAHTAFSPFFVILISIFYWFHNAPWYDIKVLGPLAYSLGLSGYCASGVGELLANTLAVRNVTVVVLDVNPIVTENYNITFYKCDVSKWEEVEAVAKKIKEEIGDPTVIVNNAGIVRGKPILELSEGDIRETFGVNTLAHWWTLKAFLPAMVKAKAGHIVTIASNLGLIGVPGLSDYCASKAAVNNLHESLRYELDVMCVHPGVRTTLVQPGYILTPLFAQINLPKWPGFNFFFPPLEPHNVAKRIIQALDEQYSQIIRMPMYVQLMPFMPAFPSFIRDLVQNISGANHAASTLAEAQSGEEKRINGIELSWSLYFEDCT